MVAGFPESEQSGSSSSKPGSAALERARAILAVRASRGGPSAVPAAEALAHLDGAYPPLPPPAPLPGGEPATGEAAESALAQAAVTAADPQEAARIALAAESLRTALE